jgi:hypothetical protein
MSESIRAFNDAGRKKWAEFIDSLKLNPAACLHEDFLLENTYTMELCLELPALDPTNKLTFVQTLAPACKILIESGLSDEQTPGLWDWLSARFFDILCPTKANGSRSVKQRDWYVFSDKYNRQYKHRIAGPVSLYQQHGDKIDFLLISTKQSLTPSSLSQLEDEVASRQDIASSSSAVAALRELYWDEEKQNQRRGAVSNTMKPGTIRRFASIFEQLERTFDISAISEKELLKLLPEREFSRWLSPLS